MADPPPLKRRQGQAPGLELPAPAVLHASTRSPDPHPDSAEFIARERQRVARELQPIQRTSSSGEPSPPFPALRSRLSRGSSASQSTPVPTTVTDNEGPEGRDIRDLRLERQVLHWYDPVVKFWTTNVSLTMDEGSQRDHLALERTFLGYLRTSLAFNMTGVLIAQLFRLQHAQTPHPVFGYYVLGKPLSVIFIGFSIVILLVGAGRFWRQQAAMVRGKIHSGGWDMTGLAVFTGLLFLTVFALMVGVDLHKEYGGKIKWPPWIKHSEEWT